MGITWEKKNLTYKLIHLEIADTHNFQYSTNGHSCLCFFCVCVCAKFSDQEQTIKKLSVLRKQQGFY